MGLERFPAKWIPVRVKKTRQNKKESLRSDSIGTEKALAREVLFALNQCYGLSVATATGRGTSRGMAALRSAISPSSLVFIASLTSLSE